MTGSTPVSAPPAVDSSTLSSVVQTVAMTSSTNEKVLSLAIVGASATICLCTMAIVGVFIMVVWRDGNTTEVSGAMQSLTIIGSAGFATLVTMLIGKSALNNVLRRLVG